jgi:hypothetical protein
VTSSIVGRHPNGSCASARVTLSRTTPSQHRRHHGTTGTTGTTDHAR